jgi:hypothetical protein
MIGLNCLWKVLSKKMQSAQKKQQWNIKLFPGGDPGIESTENDHRVGRHATVSADDDRKTN